MAKDYYASLGINKNASADEIKKAYKKMAVKYHPDVNKEKDAHEKFKEINEAYQVLSDPQKKSQYDQFGTTDFQSGGGFGGGQQGFSGFGSSSFSGFEDIFDTFFGGGGRREQRGSDIEIITQISFEDAAFGVEKELSYSVIDSCSTCDGKGGEEIKKCQQCGGSGKVSRMTRTMLGSFSQTTPCSNCKGRGETPEKICRSCGGNGLMRQQKNIKIKIPAGVNDGSSLRIIGRGEAGRDGHGDLYLQIRIVPHKEFSREGSDILSEKIISFSLAALGGKVDIETIYGPVKLTIPDGTQPNTKFVLKNKGVNRPMGKGKGDHIVTVKIKVPKKLSRAERELLEKLKEIEE